LERLLEKKAVMSHSSGLMAAGACAVRIGAQACPSHTGAGEGEGLLMATAVLPN